MDQHSFQALTSTSICFFITFTGAILYLIPFPEHGNLLSVHKLLLVPPDASLFTLISSYSN